MPKVQVELFKWNAGVREICAQDANVHLEFSDVKEFDDISRSDRLKLNIDGRIFVIAGRSLIVEELP